MRPRLFRPPYRPVASPSRGVALAAAVVAAVALTAASCGDGSAPVTVGAATRGGVVEVVDAPAAVTAKAAATVSAPADGTLATLRVSPGDQVRSGQVLAVVDSPSARTRLAQAEQALAAAGQASGGIGRGANLTRLRRSTDQAATAAFTAARQAAGKITDPRLREALLTQITAAEQQYAVAADAADRAVRAVQRGVAQLSAAVNALGTAQRLQAQQAYDLAKATVDALTLRAPISGVVQLGGTAVPSAPSLTDLSSLIDAAGQGATPTGPGAAGAGAAGVPPGVDGGVAVGGPVGAGTPVLTVVDTSVLGLVAEVDETDVLLVTPGVQADVELDAATGASYPATVRSVDVLPTPSARGGVTYRVRLTLGAGRYADERSAPTPRPGMSAVAHLRVRQAAGAVTVPAQAIFSAGGRDAVWAVRDGRAEQVTVTIGVQGQDVVQIISGLAAGQQIVVRGTDQVRTGQRVP